MDKTEDNTSSNRTSRSGDMGHENDDKENIVLAGTLPSPTNNGNETGQEDMDISQNDQNVLDDAGKSSSQPRDRSHEADHVAMETNQDDPGKPPRQQLTDGAGKSRNQDQATPGADKSHQQPTTGAGKHRKKQQTSDDDENPRCPQLTDGTGKQRNQQQTTHGTHKPNRQPLPDGVDKHRYQKQTTNSAGQRDITSQSDISYTQYDETQMNIPPRQKQLTIQRSLEASKQMLYVVYGNLIAILEEYEKREMAKYQLKQEMPTSSIPIPRQSHKSFDDVKSIVETQLLLFETQTKVCPPEALSKVVEDLKRRTISWSAVRYEMGIKEVHETDTYIRKLYEILSTGKTEHPPIQKSGVSRETMREFFPAILQGNHDREKLDGEFKKGKDKTASAPETRGSGKLRGGAERISQTEGKHNLDTFLEADLQRFEKQEKKDDSKRFNQMDLK